jgi:hypothetical protein
LGRDDLTGRRHLRRLDDARRLFGEAPGFLGELHRRGRSTHVAGHGLRFLALANRRLGELPRTLELRLQRGRRGSLSAGDAGTQRERSGHDGGQQEPGAEQ